MRSNRYWSGRRRMRGTNTRYNPRKRSLLERMKDQKHQVAQKIPGHLQPKQKTKYHGGHPQSSNFWLAEDRPNPEEKKLEGEISRG